MPANPPPTPPHAFLPLVLTALDALPSRPFLPHEVRSQTLDESFAQREHGISQERRVELIQSALDEAVKQRLLVTFEKRGLKFYVRRGNPEENPAPGKPDTQTRKDVSGDHPNTTSPSSVDAFRESLEHEVCALKSRLDVLADQEKEVSSGWEPPDDVDAAFARRITALHDYNELKDLGQSLLGKMGEIEGLTTRKMYERYGMELED
ncbi:hypothetical protein M427DRAFT_150561 [Gonapodya prolifera JEL478]|uniref:Swi5-domain-containing protein n=1 Tax=Gonapodya prolifera (strain JEL478) TaxID=1344416 RepID=A0A139AZP8_GONPJ|nr:hypothetical protein M427DRAFT_150561 [Gonapodya prolifera JEL478]|eukprot:KXS22218.1 hypothetical protein M427DRAFT_150561 [Gonapodya prolifera JEL478]